MSYFHLETSEEAKRLIGNIAPKKIKKKQEVKTNVSAVTVVKGMLAWNKAGNYYYYFPFSFFGVFYDIHLLTDAV